MADPRPPKRPAKAADKPLTRVERIFVRISILQAVVAVASIFIAAVALWAALNEADASRKQQEAMVWPDLAVASTYVTGTTDKGEPSAVFRVHMFNSGIGPARVKALRVTVDGNPQPSWRSVVTNLVGQRDTPIATDMHERTLLPGPPLPILTVREYETALALGQEIRRTDRLKVEVCYCSMFDDCWLTSMGGGGLPRANQKVDQCPDWAGQRFGYAVTASSGPSGLQNARTGKESPSAPERLPGGAGR